MVVKLPLFDNHEVMELLECFNGAARSIFHSIKCVDGDHGS